MTDNLKKIILLLLVLLPISKEAFGMTSVSSEETDHKKAFELGKKYYKEKNYAGAVKWFNQVIEDSSASKLTKGEACEYLGVMYHNGGDIPVSIDEAERWWIKGVEDYGSRYCGNHLIRIYESGTVRPKDLREAFKWRKKNAELGECESALIVGQAYETGNSINGYPAVERNNTEAIKFYLKFLNSWSSYLFNKGSRVDEFRKIVPTIEYKVGYAYLNGTDGLPQDYEAAVETFRSLVDNVEAFENKKGEKTLLSDAEIGEVMWDLGVCYRFGRGVTKNDLSARKWTRKAAERGNQKALKLLENE